MKRQKGRRERTRRPWNHSPTTLSTDNGVRGVQLAGVVGHQRLLKHHVVAGGDQRTLRLYLSRTRLRDLDERRRADLVTLLRRRDRERRRLLLCIRCSELLPCGVVIQIRAPHLERHLLTLRREGKLGVIGLNRCSLRRRLRRSTIKEW